MNDLDWTLEQRCPMCGEQVKIGFIGALYCRVDSVGEKKTTHLVCRKCTPKVEAVLIGVEHSAG